MVANINMRRGILYLLVALFLSALFFYLIYPFILAIRFNYKGEPYTLARYIAYKQNYVFKDRRVLNIADSKGCSLAYIYTMSARPINYDKTMLLTPTCTGSVLAYYVAAMGFKLPEDYEIVSKMGLDGLPIAMTAVTQAGQMFSIPKIQQIQGTLVMKDRKTVTLTVAFAMARKGYLQFNDKDMKIMKERNSKGITIAHIMAHHGHEFYAPEVLKLKTDKGVTVAHVMAICQKYQFKDQGILDMATNKGLKVKDATAINLNCKERDSVRQIYDLEQG